MTVDAKWTSRRQEHGSAVDDGYSEYNELRERHTNLKGTLFAVCALTLPLVLWFFFGDWTHRKNMDFCATLKAADYELRNSAVVLDPETAKAAIEAIAPILADCPEPEEDLAPERERPIRGM